MEVGWTVNCYENIGKMKMTLEFVQLWTQRKRLIIIHAGINSGFLDNTALIYKAVTTTGIYYGQMNLINFKKWVQGKLVPSLPSNFIVVMDSAPYYHCMQSHKVHSRYYLRSDMIYGYTERKFFWGGRGRCKEVPYMLTLSVTHMYDLSPVELGWAKV